MMTETGSPPDDELLTVQQVADLAGVSRDTVYRWIAEDRLHPAITLPSGRQRFARGDVLKVGAR
jgi:excisionase family DNA binding protein